MKGADLGHQGFSHVSNTDPREGPIRLGEVFIWHLGYPWMGGLLYSKVLLEHIWRSKTEKV